MGEHIVRKYETWGAFVDAAARPPTNYWAGENSSRRDRGRAGQYSNTWAGGTWDKSIQLAQQGWYTVRPQVERLVEDIKDDIRPHLIDTFRSDFDVAGSAVDIARYLEGEPECMVQLTPVKIAKPGRVIGILVDTSVSASIAPEDVIKRGAAICALIEVLELLQHSTELWAESSWHPSDGRDTRNTYTTLIKVKGAQDKLDIGSVLYALANPGMTRRLTFSVEEQESDEVRGRYGFYRGGRYGYPCPLTQGEAVQATVEVPKIRHQEYLVNAAEQWVRDRLVEFALIAPEPAP